MQTTSKVYKDNWNDLKGGPFFSILKPTKPCVPHYPHPCPPIPVPMPEPCPPHMEHCHEHNPLEPHHHWPEPPHCGPEHCHPCPPPPHPCHPHGPIDIDGDGWTEDTILFGQNAPEPIEETTEITYAIPEPDNFTEDETEEYEDVQDETPEEIISVESEDLKTIEEPFAPVEQMEEIVETPKRRINRGGRRKINA